MLQLTYVSNPPPPPHQFHWNSFSSNTDETCRWVDRHNLLIITSVQRMHDKLFIFLLPILLSYLQNFIIYKFKHIILAHQFCSSCLSVLDKCNQWYTRIFTSYNYSLITPTLIYHTPQLMNKKSIHVHLRPQGETA